MADNDEILISDDEGSSVSPMKKTPASGSSRGAIKAQKGKVPADERKQHITTFLRAQHSHAVIKANYDCPSCNRRNFTKAEITLHIETCLRKALDSSASTDMQDDAARRVQGKRPLRDANTTQAHERQAVSRLATKDAEVPAMATPRNNPPLSRGKLKLKKTTSRGRLKLNNRLKQQVKTPVAFMFACCNLLSLI